MSLARRSFPLLIPLLALAAVVLVCVGGQARDNSPLAGAWQDEQLAKLSVENKTAAMMGLSFIFQTVFLMGCSTVMLCGYYATRAWVVGAQQPQRWFHQWIVWVYAALAGLAMVCALGGAADSIRWGFFGVAAGEGTAATWLALAGLSLVWDFKSSSTTKPPLV